MSAPRVGGRAGIAAEPDPDLRRLLVRMGELGASDLHLGCGAPPVFRVDGRLKRDGASGGAGADGDGLFPGSDRILLSLLSETQRKILERACHVDAAFRVEGEARYRANIFHRLGGLAAAIRRIPLEIPPLAALGLPPALEKLALKPHGLVLVTGPTGCGKSTTMAALVDRLNREKALHIVTLEDPIEFVHAARRSLITQREIGRHAHDFCGALKYALRQDPDVVLIGELRDPDTIGAALTMAETGHLVLATLHTNSAVESVSRMVDAFPGDQRDRTRSQLAHVLEGVLTQRLLPRANGKGRVCAVELMICTSAIRTVIRDDKLHQAQSLIQTSRGSGMRTMAESLRALCLRGDLAPEEALRHVDDQGAFMRTLGDPWG
ncbi:MAG: PilT/PilU family type 4a pilus ATPase [Gemmatimonadetes bacterium]|nr:PilT/PilU family type 4a pilus ATPase [Gemmatimonadota bacterium]